MTFTHPISFVCVTFAVAIALRAADPVPLGHPEFVPTPQRPIGYRGDGSNVYPGANPPVECDTKSGKNILWKAPLPHFGHSCPIVVGPRVFVTCEGGYKADWPVLLCFDANTGKELWRRELNHLPASTLDAQQQAQVAKAWHEFLGGWARGYTAMHRWRSGDDTAKKEADKLLAEAGFRPRGENHKDSPAAVRFSLSGDKLKASAIWNGIGGQAVTAYECMVYHGGKLYIRGAAVDALSGKLLGGSVTKGGRSTAVPGTRHMLVIAGDRIYGLSEAEDKTTKIKYGVLEAYSLDGKKLGQGILHPAAAEGEKAQQIRQTVGRAAWGFNYSCPFTVAGNRLYARSNDELICVGTK